MTDADRVAATLAGIRERQSLAADASLGFSRMNERHDALIKVAYEDTPRLLSALDRVLELTAPSSEIHRDLDGNEESGLIRLVRCDRLREAIRAELTGEEADHA